MLTSPDLRQMDLETTSVNNQEPAAKAEPIMEPSSSGAINNRCRVPTRNTSLQVINKTLKPFENYDIIEDERNERYIQIQNVCSQSRNVKNSAHNLMDYRYQIRGQFADRAHWEVLDVRDLHQSKDKALKIAKRKLTPDDGTSCTEREYKILRRLNDSDPKDNHHIVKVYDSLMVKERPSLTLEPGLKYVVNERSTFLRKIKRVRNLMKGVLDGLEYLKTFDIIHTRINMYNIGFAATNDPDVFYTKIMNFDHAVYACEVSGKLPNKKIDQPLFQRAPEVILGFRQLTTKIDVWGFGVMLVYLMTGEDLFKGQTSIDQLAEYTSLFGDLTKEILSKATGPIVNEDGQIVLPRGSYEHNEGRKGCQRFSKTVKYKDNETIAQLSQMYNKHPDSIKCLDDELTDLLANCFKLCPRRRITASSAATHPWIQRTVDEIEID